MNSGGIFRKGYTEKKKNVEQNAELSASSTTAKDKSFVQTDLVNGSESADTHSDNQLSSESKDTTTEPITQEVEQENLQPTPENVAEEQMEVSQLENEVVEPTIII